MSICVIGASNIDYLAKADNPLIPEDSNIGHLNISFGGVGRNVVENLAHLNAKNLTFLTAIGNDVLGQELKKNLENLGVTVIYPTSHQPSAAYIAIQSPDGDMALALSDMSIVDLMTPTWLNGYQAILDSSDVLVLDANLSSLVLDHLFKTNAHRPICMDTISTKKAERIIPYLSQLTLLKANLLEAQHITGLQEPTEIVKALLHLGCKNVVISSGKGPIYYGNSAGIEAMMSLEATQIVSTTGCGDSLFSGIVYALAHNKTLKEGVALGRQMSYHTLFTSQAVASDMLAWLIEKNIKF